MEDEIMVLESVYCMPGELEIVKGASDHADIHVTLNMASENGVELKVIFNTGTSYPNTIPDISLFSNTLNRDTIKTLRENVLSCAQDKIGCPMLMDLVSQLQEEISNIPKEICETKDEITDMKREDIGTLLIHIDHMRSKTQYVKTIKKWTEDLCLCGRLFFCNRLIILLLQGNETNLKEYLVRHKSVNIDVDSRGHPCKEKMMSILWDKPLPHNHIYMDFQVMEYQSKKLIQEHFTENKLTDLFESCIKTIKGFT